MTEYVVKLENDFNTTNSPIVFAVGQVVQKTPTYNCITRLDNSQFVVKSQDKEKLQEVASNVVQSSIEGNYAAMIYGSAISTPILYPLRTYQLLNINNHDTLLNIYNQELPAVYNAIEPLNNADNFGATGVLASVYEYVYDLYFNSISSIGSEKSYNPQWELVYVGANNFLSNAYYPSQFLKTLMQVSAQTGTTRHALAICISRLLYQYLNISVPCEIKYNSASKRWDINLYSDSFTAWLLGVVGNSELGFTTVLSSRSARASYLWFIYVLAQRLFPTFAKFQINLYDLQLFRSTFDTTIVGEHDFYNPSHLYGAYSVVNNNNSFNTKGYIYA